MSDENKKAVAVASQGNALQSSTLIEELEILLASLQRSGLNAWSGLGGVTNGGTTGTGALLAFASGE